MTSPNFWNDKKHSEEVINTLNSEKKVLNDVETLLEETKDYLEMAKTINNNDTESLTWLEKENQNLTKNINAIETIILLNDTYDKNDAVLEIHSGAGGTEACDWANMLLRMYTRYA